MINVTQIFISSYNQVVQKATCDEFITDVVERKNCHCGFKLADSTAKVACGVSLNYLCDAEYCPQNFFNSICREHTAYDGKDVENFEC